jgi:hypothetical protein
VCLLEAFVNTSPDIPVSQRFSHWAIEALDAVKVLYGERIIIAEYHRSSKTLGYLDPLDLDDRYEPLYERYVFTSGSGQKGVPDIFINGSVHRVQGASDVESVKERLSTILAQRVLDDGLFLLEPVVDQENNRITVSCRLARLGNQSVEDLRLRLIFTRKLDNLHLKRVVVAEDEVGKYTEAVSRIEAGEYLEIDFEPIVFSELPDVLIIALTSQDDTEIYASVKMDL